MTYINTSPLAYPSNFAQGIRQYVLDRNPTSADFKQFVLGDEWLNTQALTWWKLANKTSAAGFWIQMGGSLPSSLQFIPDSGTSPVTANVSQQLRVAGGTGIQVVGSASTLTFNVTSEVALTFTGDSGTATPVADNLNIFGSGGITTSASGDTVTIASTGAVATSYVEDTGSAVPALGVLNIVGGTGVATSGSGNTVTIAATASVATSYVEDTGTATPAANVLHISGGTGIATTGSGNTVTIAATGSVADLYTANSGTATPSANNLNILGSGGITTTGSGSTITITGSPGGLTWNLVTTNTSMTTNNGYLVNSGSLVTLTLPASSAQFDMVEVVGEGAGGWKIAQNAGQSIVYLGSTSTVGVGGSVTPIEPKATIILICTVANTTWQAQSSIGNFTIV